MSEVKAFECLKNLEGLCGIAECKNVIDKAEPVHEYWIEFIEASHLENMRFHVLVCDDCSERMTEPGVGFRIVSKDP